MSPTQKSILMNLALTQLNMARATAMQAIGEDTDSWQFLNEQFEELEADMIADLVGFDEEIAQLQRINSIV